MLKKSDFVLLSFFVTVGLYLYYYYFLISDLPVWVNDLKACGSVMELGSFIKGHLNIFAYLFITGVMTFFILKTIYKFFINLKEYFRLQKYIKKHTIKRYKNLRIIDTKDNIAFSFGIFKTGIALSKNLFKNFSKKEIKNIYLHEKGHLLNGDSYKLFIFSILANLFPSKLRDKLIKDFSLLKEVEADDYCSEKTDKIQLAQTILKFYSVQANLHIPMMNSYIETRIKFLTEELNYKKINPQNVYFTFLALLIFFLLLSYLFQYCLCGMSSFMSF